MKFFLRCLLGLSTFRQIFGSLRIGAEEGLLSKPLLSKDSDLNVPRDLAESSSKAPSSSSPIESSRSWTGFWSNVGQRLSFSTPSDYEIFYGLAKSIERSTRDDDVKTFAHDILGMGKTIMPEKNPGLSRSHLSPIPRLNAGVKLLDKQGLSIDERVWILGILACLEEHVPWIYKNYATGISATSGSLPKRGELELALTRGKIEAETVRSLMRQEISPRALNKVIREALQRTKTFNDVQKTLPENVGLLELPTRLNKIHNFLLRLTLPVSTQEAESFLKDFHDIMVDTTILRWEKKFAYAICTHIIMYDTTTSVMFLNLMFKDSHFRNHFYRIRAYEIFHDFLAETAQSARGQWLMSLFNDLDHLTAQAVVPVLDSIVSDELNLPDRIRLYHLVDTGKVFNDGLQKIWYKELEKYRVIPFPLVMVLRKIYPSLEPEHFTVANYEYAVFRDNPGLLDAARRAMIAQQFTHKHPRNYLGHYLNQIPWQVSKPSQNVDKLFNNLITLIANDHVSRSAPMELQMIRFEALVSLMDYNGVYESRTWYAMKRSRDVMDSIGGLCEEVINPAYSRSSTNPASRLVESTTTTGIAPGSLFQSAKRIRDEIARILYQPYPRGFNTLGYYK